MDLGLTGRAAIVLASSQGLGKASAMALAREGANVVICARRKGPLLAAQAEIKSVSQGEVLAVQLDLTLADDLKRLVGTTIDTFGRIDVLVTNSGPPPSGKFFDLGIEQWNVAVESLLLSVVRICYRVIPIMRKQRWGRIIHISSTSVKQPLGHLMLSSAARMGIVGLSKITSNEFAADNVLVHTVCPGPFLTEAEVDFFDRMAKEKGVTAEEAQRQWLSDIPMRRIGRPEEFGDVVAFLASERASFMTGTVVQVDGGRIQSML